jgi:hypothetical protein
VPTWSVVQNDKWVRAKVSSFKTNMFSKSADGIVAEAEKESPIHRNLEGITMRCRCNTKPCHTTVTSVAQRIKFMTTQFADGKQSNLEWVALHAICGEHVKPH